MKKTINDLTSSLWTEGWDAIDRLREEFISSDNYMQLLIDLFNNEDIKYKHASIILLKIPELWKNLDLDDWREIIRSVKRPEKYRILMDDSSHFEDVKFLYNWIEIDSIQLYREDPSITEKDKKTLDRIMAGFSIDFNKDSNYMEDFEDGTFREYETLKITQEKLVRQGAKKRIATE